MRYHDYQLSGYSVSDGGSRIVLHLIYDYAGHPKNKSDIEFSDVACYHFTHTTKAIITRIDEVNLVELVNEEAARLSAFEREYGLTHWRTGIPEYLGALQKLGLRAWRLESGIGFGGFVIGRSVEQVPESSGESKAV